MKLYVTLLSGFLQDSVYYNSNHVLQSSKITWISFLILYNQMKIIWVHRKWEIEISIPAKTRNRTMKTYTSIKRILSVDHRLSKRKDMQLIIDFDYFDFLNYFIVFDYFNYFNYFDYFILDISNYWSMSILFECP